MEMGRDAWQKKGGGGRGRKRTTDTVKCVSGGGHREGMMGYYHATPTWTYIGRSNSNNNNHT